MKTHPRNYLPYNPNLKARARELRKQGTLGEVLLWQTLRKKALGWEFHRQVPISEFIVDFYCHELLLALEVDGSSHEDEDAYMRDMRRQAHLEALGIRFLRFREIDVRDNLEGVIETIQEWIKKERQTSP